MAIQQLLNSTAHRPFKLAKGNWQYYQEWNRVLFLHWRVDYDLLRAAVPQAIEIDTFEGSCWISLVAFTMENVRPRYVPAFQPISNFDEINIRTYVKGDNMPGVYFLSIEAGNRLSASIAHFLSKMPYRYSNMSRVNGNFCSENKDYEDAFNVDYGISTAKISKTNLDIWLTERYAVFQDWKDGINKFEVHHDEWPVCNVDIKALEIRYDRFHHFLSSQPDLAHYSQGVEVLAWPRNKI